ncbi:MAG TPA: hypothetical protein VIG88_00110 [Lysobacter sp.]
MLSSPVLYARGPYRVIANDPDAPGRMYVVVDTAGAWLREEPGFDAARAWVDHRSLEHGGVTMPASGSSRRVGSP